MADQDEHHHEKISTKPLTPLERRELRILLRDKERRVWLRRQFAIWLKYLGSFPTVAAGAYFAWKWLEPVFNAMPKK